MTNEELRRLATAVNVTTSHVGATQEIWDAINVDLQQILDDVSCWEGRHAERMCERLETAIKRLNAAVGHEREGYETAIAVGYENDALRTRLAEVEKDAARLKYLTEEYSVSLANMFGVPFGNYTPESEIITAIISKIDAASGAKP